MNIVAVECFADQYFFGKLLGNKEFIRKEKNKNEVIKAFSRVKDNFLIGIVDEDRKDLLSNPNVQSFKLLKNRGDFKVYKDKNKFHFIFVLSPKAFEDWIIRFVESKGEQLSSFGYSDFDEFRKETKDCNISKDSRYTKLVNYILQNYQNDDNHISDFKKHIDYLITHKYNFNEVNFCKI